MKTVISGAWNLDRFSLGRGSLLNRSIATLAIAAVTLFGAHGSRAELTQNWRVDAGAVTWLTAAGGGARGMSYNPVTDHVLVCSTEPALGIQVLDASNAASIGTMNVTGVSGGTTAATKVRVVDLGGGSYSVYACNLVANNKTASLTIYRWTGTGSETALAAPTTIYRNRASDGTAEASPIGPTMPAAGAATHRIGDGMDVKISGTSTELYLGRSDAATQNSVYKFAYTEGNAAVATVTGITLTGATGATYRGTTVDGFGGNIYQFSNGSMARYTNAGASQVSFPGIVAVGSVHPRYGTINSRNYIAYLDANPEGTAANTFRRGAVVDVTPGMTSVGLADISTKLSTTNANGNTTGDADFDTLRNRVLFLVTNNFLGSFSIPTGTTKLWNGGASGSWHNASNWSPTGIPTGSDNVVLDNTLVTGSYVVTVDSATETESCKTLTVGDTSSGNLIRLRVNSAVRAALLVGGSQDAADDIVCNNGGRIENASTAAAGNPIDNRSGGFTYRVKSGGAFLWDTALSFLTPFPGGSGTFENGSTMEFSTNIPAGNFQFSGRTYGNLVLSSTSAKTFTAAPNSPSFVLNDLVIGTNCTFNVTGTSSMTIGGNITSNGAGGAIDAALSVIMGSSGGSSLNGSGTALTFPSGITINSGNSMTLVSQDLAIPGTKTATINGVLNTGARTLVVGSSSTSLATLAGTGYVNGNLKRYVSTAAQAYAFPLGNIGAARTANVDFSAGAPGTGGSLTASFVSANPGTNGLPLVDGSLSLSKTASEGYWAIASGDGLAGGTYDLSLTGEGFGAINDVSMLRTIKRPTSANPWTLDGVAGTNTGTVALPTVVRTGLSGFSEFAIASDNSQLPVGLSGFSVE